jgi:hypothetical protein
MSPGDAINVLQGKTDDVATVFWPAVPVVV